MYTRKTRIRMRHTDATGALYFTAQLDLASETFEEFLDSKGFSLDALIKAAPYLLPVVHVDANYLSPLHVGDKISIHLAKVKTGTSSFTLHYDFFKEDEEIAAGTATITHVVVSKEAQRAVPIPSELLSLFQGLE